jgi:RNase P/RNase MRP subunit POP5
VIQKDAEKILKYRELTIEIQRVWNVKTRVIPIIIGVTGTIPKSLRKYMSTIPGNHDIREI